MFTSLIAIASLAALGLANPVVKRDAPTDVNCGTTGDATLSDCEALVNDPAIWNAAFTTDNICTFTNVLANRYAYPAANLACHGNCCVYFTDHYGGARDLSFTEADRDQSRTEAQSLLGCGDRGSNKINVLGKFPLHYLCLSNGGGCGDCFDDADFAF